MRVLQVLQLASVALPVWRVAAVPFEHDQKPLIQVQQPDTSNAGGTGCIPGQRKLRGRFLHVTDFHPDPFYKVYSSTAKEEACHGDHGPSGYYGAETSDCDSPITLVNATFNWIKEHVVDDIDFVIWTGDSARHDNDERIPRSDAQVMTQNRLLVSKFNEVFGKPDNINDTDPTNDFIVPIVPTFGNNDILPHNIFLPGPNRWTTNYLDIWRQFIPEEQRHGFHEGGWFHVEVIPGKLAVLSLNTLYFFDSNSATDGCAAKSEPGYEHMEWLRIQLQFLRERGMKAMLIGHVPPARTYAKQSWDETCWQKYTLNLRQYRDVVVGSFYGHMNIDHFIMQDFKDIDVALVTGEKQIGKKRAGGRFSISSAADYLLSLRHVWTKLPSPPTDPQMLWSEEYEQEQSEEQENDSWWDWLEAQVTGKHGKKGKKKKPGKGGKKQNPYKKIGGPYAERYAVSHVQSSVVPNFFPTLRIVEYNITGLEDYAPSQVEAEVEATRKGKKDKKKPKRPKKPNFTVPDPPAKTAPPGPAYSPQTLSLLGYTQYFANLTYINNDFSNETDSDFLTILEGDTNHGKLHSSENDGISTDKRWRDGKHGNKKPHLKHPKPHPKKFKYQVEYSTFKDKIYRLKDLSVLSYLDLARQIALEARHKGGSAAQLEEECQEAVKGECGQSLSDTSTYVKRPDHTRMEALAERLATIPELSTEAEQAHAAEEDSEQEWLVKKKMNKVWFTFIKRAFVGTMDPDDIQEQFGQES